MIPSQPNGRPKRTVVEVSEVSGDGLWTCNVFVDVGLRPGDSGTNYLGVSRWKRLAIRRAVRKLRKDIIATVEASGGDVYLT